MPQKPTGPGLIPPGTATHGAYAVDRRVRYDEIDGRTRLGRRAREMRLAYAVAYGYPTWEGVPRPLQAAIKSAVRLELFVERLFSGFWSGKDVSKRFDTASENLRRILSDMGLEPRMPTVDAAAILAGMRTSDATKETRPGATQKRT